MIESTISTCKFYELDSTEKAAHDAYLKSLSVEELDGYARLEVYIESENTFCAGCGEFCKYLSIDEGLMYETVYCCKAPGNAHIIGVESDDIEGLC